MNQSINNLLILSAQFKLLRGPIRPLLKARYNGTDVFDTSVRQR